MRSKRAILHRAVMVVAVVAAVLAVAGCSSVEPENVWDSETGRVNGTIRSDTGAALPDIEIWLWGELAPDGHEACYQTVTGTDGTYEINGESGQWQTERLGARVSIVSPGASPTQ